MKRYRSYCIGIRSDEFRDGAYRNKTIIVHSNSEIKANTRLLLGVENPENPVDIVIHVNILTEDWDVNNLYTIVPLRTAASKILREQMVGRVLRWPYGEYNGDRDIDAVHMTSFRTFSIRPSTAIPSLKLEMSSRQKRSPMRMTYIQVSLPQPPSAVREETYTYTSLPRSHPQ